MKRGFLVAALCLVSVAYAADKKPTKKDTATTQKDAGTAKKAPTLSKELSQELKTTKQAFMAAVGSCARPDLCDPGSRSANRELIDLVTSTEENFVTACRACSTDEKCERERQRIRDGKNSRGLEPCK